MPFWRREHSAEAGGTAPDERALLEALRDREETAYVAVVEQHHESLVRLAMIYVHDQTIAEEVAQETWVGVLGGIDRFEGRSSLRTWITRILLNVARTRAVREARTMSFTAVAALMSDAGEPSVDPSLFDPVDHHWASAPVGWDETPEDRLISRETRERIQSSIEALPVQQREVITLRDVEGWGSAEVCNILDLSESNQRVLLHRARAKVRRALEDYLGSPASKST